jgi:ornithine carbamoyltransferase|tara:strand:+ start:214 stop:1134 length:921 start_codon:yes stop_codon:yes gene_type:complete
MVKHFLNIDLVGKKSLRKILSLSRKFKKDRKKKNSNQILSGKILGMIFVQPSTRTRVSFEIGMKQLGGDVVILDHLNTQLVRGETMADTARVLSRYLDIMMIRTGNEKDLIELAENSSIPVINGLTDQTHPCQIVGDVLTFEEKLGTIQGKKIAWIGDVNNVANSWIHASITLGFTLNVGCSPQLPPSKKILNLIQKSKADIHIHNSAAEAVKGADCVITDTWVSMNNKNIRKRKRLLKPYQVDTRLMRIAKKNAIFMHCLPAHRGEEVTDSVIDGSRSVVWDEAENRLHAQKGIIAWCLSKNSRS